MSVTIKQLASLAKVSVSTVSRALNNDPLIAHKTRAFIQNLAQQHDYVPNNIGKGLQSRKSYLIGYLVSSMKNSFYEDILQGIGKVACENNYGLLMAITNDNPKNEKDQLRIFREKSVDGIIVSNYHKDTIAYLRKIEASGIPIVLCDIDPYDQQVPVVRTDDCKATEMLADHLVGLGHKNFAYCFIDNTNSLNRFSALKAYLKRNRLPAPHTCHQIGDLVQLLLQPSKPTAIMCYSDQMAVKVVQTLRSLAIRVPEMCSVTGFDDMDYASWPEYNLTTISQPKMELGMYAAEVLFRLIDNKPGEQRVIFEPHLTIRNSTAIVKK